MPLDQCKDIALVKMEESTSSTFFENQSVLGVDSYDSASGNPFMRDTSMLENTDSTYTFLQKKLVDANETISSYSQQEVNFKCDIERLNSENEDLTKQVTTLKADVDTLRNKYVATDQKLQSELRARNTLQDSIKDKEAEIFEEKARSKKYENYVKEMRSKVSSYEREMTKFQEFIITSFQCKDSLLKNSKELHDVIEQSKEVIKILQADKSLLSDKLNAVEVDLESYEINYEELSAQVEQLKDESNKQETYIKSILDGFKELDLHFRNMRTYYEQQKAKVDAAQKEIVQKCSKEELLKGDAVAKINEMEKYKKEVQEK